MCNCNITKSSERIFGKLNRYTSPNNSDVEFLSIRQFSTLTGLFYASSSTHLMHSIYSCRPSLSTF